MQRKIQSTRSRAESEFELKRYDARIRRTSFRSRYTAATLVKRSPVSRYLEAARGYRLLMGRHTSTTMVDDLLCKVVTGQTDYYYCVCIVLVLCETLIVNCRVMQHPDSQCFLSQTRIYWECNTFTAHAHVSSFTVHGAAVKSFPVIARDDALLAAAKTRALSDVDQRAARIQLFQFTTMQHTVLNFCWLNDLV